MVRHITKEASRLWLHSLGQHSLFLWWSVHGSNPCCLQKLNAMKGIYLAIGRAKAVYLSRGKWGLASELSSLSLWFQYVYTSLSDAEKLPYFRAYARYRTLVRQLRSSGSFRNVYFFGDKTKYNG